MKLRNNFSFLVKPFERDIVQERIGDYPQKYLLSPVLKEAQEVVSQEIKDSMNLDFQFKYEPNKIGRQKEYFVTQQKYKEFAYKHPHGKVHIFKYQNVNFTLAGSQWEHIPAKNLYKLLLFSRPELIMLQIRPDQILKGFNYQYKSSKDYVDQIIREPDEVMPVEYISKIAQILDKEELKFTEYEPFINKERIPNEKIATLCYYAKKFGIKIMLADLPSLIFRESLCNQFTLPQLQQLFDQSTEAVPLNPDIIPNTPMNIAYQLIPHIFLKRSDEFMTTLIEYLAAKQSYKKVLGIFGNMQSDSIVDLLNNKSSSHLKYELEIPKIKKTMFKDLTCEDLLERHAILDVMYYKNITKISTPQKQGKYFPESLKIIDKFADPQFIDKTRKAQMKYFHLEMINKYQIFLTKNLVIGKDKLEDEYLIKANNRI